MPRWKRYSLLTGSSVLGLLLLSMLIVPWQVKKQGSAWFADNTSRRLTIEKVFFNPFTLTLEISGLKLTEQHSDRTFVAWQRLMLSVSSRSLLDLAVILDRVELDDPVVNIELLGKEEFNFSDFTRLSGESPKPPVKEPDNPLHFSLNNIVITGGAVDISDRTAASQNHHQIRELSLSVPYIGNIPYLADRYVEPQLRMLLNGSEVRAAGELKPFARSLQTSLTLLLEDIDLPFYAYRSPVSLPIEVKSGRLDSQIDLDYWVSSTDQPRLLVSGELALTDIDLRELDGRHLFRMPTLILELERADVMHREFNLLSLDIYEPQLSIDRDRQGRWNLQRILPPPQAAQQPVAEEASPLDLPLLRIGVVRLMDGQVHYQDDFVPEGFHEELKQINLTLTALSTEPGVNTGLTFKLLSDRGLTTELSGEVGLNPVTALLNLLANDIPLQPYYPYLEPFLTSPISGVVNLAGGIEFREDGNLLLRQAQLTLHDLLLPFPGEDRFTLAELAITGGSFDLMQRKIGVEGIRLSRGNLIATRLPDGSVTPLKLLREQKQPQESTPPDSPGQSWQAHVGSLVLERFGLELTDAGPARKPQLKIARLDLNVEDLAYPESAQSPFRLRTKIGGKGSIDMIGNLAHSPLRLQAETRIKSLQLADFNDFLPDNVQVSLKDGQLNSTLMVKLEQTPETVTGNFAGRLNLSGFNLRDPLTDGELLTWEGLNLEGIKGRIGPFALQIKAVALNNYQAHILIAPDGRINLTGLTAEQPELDAVTESEQPPAKQEIAATESGPPPDISIDALTLQGGTVSFTDRHLPSTFSTTMYELGGRVTGIASAEEMLADVDLRGQLENHSPLTITGRLNPLSKDLFADLKIRFEDIDLAPMTPYSGTYLGYVIERGKLYLDLDYHIEHRKITARNQIMIDQFTFGAAVQSEQATSLPVRLAIALLKNRNGEIHLDVPVSGDLNDPSFSVAGAVITILRNLLVKVATSPFSLLAAMLGSEEDFSSINFAGGLASLSEEDRRKLAKLADMLAQRPALTLQISGFADRDRDPEGYRREQLRQRLVAAKWRDLKEAGQAPEKPEQVVFSPEEYPELLTTVYREADFPRPRNFIGLLKTLPPAEMEKLLLANTLVGDEQLAELAKQRAFQVRDLLVTLNEQIKPQLFLKQADIFQPPKTGPASRVEFEISSK